MSGAEGESAARFSSLAETIAAWFRRGHRDLPWRRMAHDPYAVWVSEIMLQQTQVATVAPRFSRWMARFPTVRALARAPLDDVLAEWAGLGYYARARNLHAAARQVDERYGGRVPDDEDAVRSLPGVGRYTTGAILSIAFGRPAPILDGNVERVLSRVFRVTGDPREKRTRDRLWTLAERVVAASGEASRGPSGSSASSAAGSAAGSVTGSATGSAAGSVAGSVTGSAAGSVTDIATDIATNSATGTAAASAYGSRDVGPSPSEINQGLMELGATVCTPRSPICLACPLLECCDGRRHGDAERLPEASRRQKVGERDEVCVAVVKDGDVLLLRRPPEGLWGGLFELACGAPLLGESAAAAARRIAFERAGIDVPLAALAAFPAPDDRFTHQLSHLRITMRPFLASAPPRARVRRAGYDAHRWVAPRLGASLGISRVTRRLLDALLAMG